MNRVTLLRSRDAYTGEAAARTRPRRPLLVLCLLVVVVRLTYVRHPLRPDEAGYLLIAREWEPGGEFLYGDYYVDRPPLLMLIFRVAALSDWDPMIRVVAIPFTLVFVVAAWQAGDKLAGRAGAIWAAVVGAALMCSPAIAADQADSALFAAALVMSAIALTLTAWHAPRARPRMLFAVAAGLFAGAAPLVKQNFFGGVLFIAVLVLVACISSQRVGPRERRVAGGAVVGVVVPHLVALAWAASVGIDPSSIWGDLASFRVAAFEVILAGSLQAPVARALRLVLLGLVSGALVVVGFWGAAARPWRLRGDPVQWATTVVLGFALASIVAGGSYWPHYLVQLAPGVVLAVASVAPTPTREGRRMRLAGIGTAAAAVVGSLALSVYYEVASGGWAHHRTGEWLAASSNSGDTAFVAYGNVAVLETADMGSPYPHLWSLPMRTIDPDQTRLRSTIAGPEAPTWIVEFNAFNSWDIDERSLLRDLVTERYRIATEVCGNRVWLRRDVTRSFAPVPDC